jgi:phage-related baseplate assembly protein
MNATRVEDEHLISGEEDMSVAEMVKKALRGNPDLKLAIEAAERARELESIRPVSDVVPVNVSTIPTNSQGLVPPERLR